jgi:hypothetical protein
MSITLTSDQVHFQYGKNCWNFTFDEIAELGILRKKKTYIFVNASFILVTVMAYYCMIFSHLVDMYYIIPTLLCYSLLTIIRFHDNVEFEYYVLLRHIDKKEIKVKIKASDRHCIGKQIDQYLDIQFDRMIKKTA